jgi:hypothetical protein
LRVRFTLELRSADVSGVHEKDATPTRTNSRSLIRDSGQTWKLATGAALFLAGGVGMLAGIANDHLLGDIGGLLVIATAMVATCWGVRCPRCRDPWVWRAISTQDAGVWVPWLLALRTCPGCATHRTTPDRSATEVPPSGELRSSDAVQRHGVGAGREA